MDVVLQLEGVAKKKYRFAAELTFVYGFRVEFFRHVSGSLDESGNLTPDAVSGLYFNSRRCLSQVGAQSFKAGFFLSKLGCYLDDDLLDAMSKSGDLASKQSIGDWYVSKYEEAMKQQKAQDIG